MLSMLLLSAAALAHKPSFDDGIYTSPDTAFRIDDIDISIVLYSEITCDDPELWMTFTGEAGQELYVQVGVPVIDRLEDYRPSVAVLGQGMPAIDLPFETPEGLGGYRFDSDDIEVPGEFYEAFTQTESWIVTEETLTLNNDGVGYLVGWNPEAYTGKMWIAVGTVENFDDVDFSVFGEWLTEVQTYHEVDDGDYDDLMERDCAAEAAAEAADPVRGCATPVTPAGWLALVGLFAVRRRSRSGSQRPV